MSSRGAGQADLAREQISEGFGIQRKAAEAPETGVSVSELEGETEDSCSVGKS